MSEIVTVLVGTGGSLGIATLVYTMLRIRKELADISTKMITDAAVKIADDKIAEQTKEQGEKCAARAALCTEVTTRLHTRIDDVMTELLRVGRDVRASNPNGDIKDLGKKIDDLSKRIPK